MKHVTLVIAMIMFSSCVTSKFTAGELESSTNQELFLSRSHPKPHWPFRGPGKRFPPILPTPFHLPYEITRCLSDKEKVRTCFDDITQTLLTREKAVVGSECCDAINKMNADCEKIVFRSFRSPILTGYVKLHCSSVLGSSSHVPSQPLSPAPSQLPSSVPSQFPLHAPSHASSPAPSPVQGF